MYVSQHDKIKSICYYKIASSLLENLFSEVWRYFVDFPHCFCLEMRMFMYILFDFPQEVKPELDQGLKNFL
jgi:hypothetical protein